MPDTFFRNERRGAMHNVLVPNLYVRIYADGGYISRFYSASHVKCFRNCSKGRY